MFFQTMILIMFPLQAIVGQQVFFIGDVFLDITRPLTLIVQALTCATHRGHAALSYVDGSHTFPTARRYHPPSMASIGAWRCHQWDRDRYILLLLSAPPDVIQCELAVIKRPCCMSLKSLYAV